MGWRSGRSRAGTPWATSASPADHAPL
jgi:hypothetical protein